MRIFMRIAVACFLSVSVPVLAAAQEAAYVVIDMGSGSVLGHRDANRLWQPASLTKLMTAYVTFKAIRAGQVSLASRVVISQNALKEPPAKMGYRVGTEMTLDNALKMMIVRSANDIAVAVAETVGGSEAAFVARMNAEAARLGMAATHFANPNGLPNDGQVTTARDLAVLSRTLWLEFPEYRPLFRIPAIKAGKKVLRSQNTLLERFRGTNGMKTGFICASGFNIVASANRSGRSLAVVLLGAETAKERAEMAARLLDDGFRRRLRGGGGSLASFRTRGQGPLVNLRQQVCGKGERGEGEEDVLLARATANSALEPRFILMEPVAVWTGVGKDATTAEPNRLIPIPRPRPPMPGDSAASIDLGAFGVGDIVQPEEADALH